MYEPAINVFSGSARWQRLVITNKTNNIENAYNKAALQLFAQFFVFNKLSTTNKYIESY